MDPSAPRPTKPTKSDMSAATLPLFRIIATMLAKEATRAPSVMASRLLLYARNTSVPDEEDAKDPTEHTKQATPSGRGLTSLASGSGGCRRNRTKIAFEA